MNRPGSALTRGKPRKPPPVPSSGVNAARKASPEAKKPELEDFLRVQDYAGATTLLNFEFKAREERQNASLWMAYCCYHNGDYKRALDIYDELMQRLPPEAQNEIRVFRGCCLYALCEYKEAEEEALKAGNSPQASWTALQTRLLFHVYHKMGDEKNESLYEKRLTNSIEDELCLAANKYLKNQFNLAADIYKRKLLADHSLLALNVYLALCWYKLDGYDVALELLNQYLHSPMFEGKLKESITAINLKACCNYQLYNGKAAEMEIRDLQNLSNSSNLAMEHDLLRHNTAVFKNGESALQVFPPLMDLLPEARLNLLNYHMRNQNVKEAHQLVKDLEAVSSREIILKAVVFAAFGQAQDPPSTDHLELAQRLFQLVGAHPNECDTIPGRQCMASCFFLLKQFEEVLVYLKSIKSYFQSDDDFNWNYGIACANAGDFREGRDTLLLVQNERYRSDFCYISWLCRASIMSNDPASAWEMYSQMEVNGDSFNILQLIANDCYRMGQFYWACRAYDVLERLEPDPDFLEGKRCSAIGVFQQCVVQQMGGARDSWSRDASPDRLLEVVKMLRSSDHLPQIDYTVGIMKRWAKEHRIKID
uniref:Intraflagellar transport protein 56 n=2 Tax=Chromera velia TaxID=505693 RepID=A0A0G4GS65_9ALVE|eukprot:Cvel_23144.t1-p1 / transcript=Cvel_23144.t1 / gene=Cvel_23144 / organism=Chromera_velia_CCMP2878 / gene_product=Tetratricopeptide repeat protein 26, putative / transcript_product=Tetratricopeptide repeat protein 26, putative / location=Cvel_scaffold2353:9349-12911(+) / protein_length=593 / sequence_SO=supercontig / SO=protein_coding / is_pseudo=false